MVDLSTVLHLIDRLRDAAARIEHAETLSLVRAAEIRLTEMVADHARLTVEKLEVQKSQFALEMKLLRLEAAHAALVQKEADREAQANRLRQLTAGQ